jgi:hypothetical protein
MTDPGGGDLGGGLGGNDLKQPPAYIDGSGGGPAMPSGPVVSSSDKDLDQDVEDIFNLYGDAWWAACA